MALALFDENELSDFLRYPVSEEAAAIAERVAWGWLTPVLGLSVRPEPCPDQVFSWAIELAAIAHETPNGAITATANGATSDTYGAPRRQQILAEAKRWVDSSGAGRGSPIGCFPPARAWPDPARPRYGDPWLEH